MPHQDIEALGYSAVGLLVLVIDIAVIFEVMNSDKDFVGEDLVDPVHSLLSSSRNPLLSAV